MDEEFILVAIDTKKLYETTRISWEIAIFPKGTQNEEFWPKCKGGPCAKFSKSANFLAELSMVNRNLSKDTQNGQFWPKCKGKTPCKIL